MWVVRYNKIPPHMYWGFQQLGDAEIQGVLQQAKAVLFLGGSLDHNLTEMHESVEKVLRWFPGMTAEQIQQVCGSAPSPNSAEGSHFVPPSMGSIHQSDVRLLPS